MSYLYIESLWGGVALRVDIIQPILKGIIDEISCDHTYKGMPVITYPNPWPQRSAP